jgi:periplasmic divalent cation tolerance protein
LKNKPIVVFCTTPDIESAKKIAHAIIENNKAACCNIVQNIISVYSWESKINEDDEYLLIIKASRQAYSALEEQILKLHPYALPEIIFFDIDGGYKKYIDWIMKSTR